MPNPNFSAEDLERWADEIQDRATFRIMAGSIPVTPPECAALRAHARAIRECEDLIANGPTDPTVTSVATKVAATKIHRILVGASDGD